jgi:lipopolysaccharide export system protein LptC
MSVLALGSYWLVRTAPRPPGPSAPTVVAHAPDFFMEKFSIKNFNGDGSLHAEVLGSAARHYSDARWTEVDAIALRAQDAAGRHTRASANKALANEDASEVQLIGNANVVRDAQTQGPGAGGSHIEFQGEFLHLLADAGLVKSHLPVELRHGANRFTADTLDYDDVTQVLRLHGRVHATLVPQATSVR